jgi:hypothetical protein
VEDAARAALVQIAEAGGADEAEALAKLARALDRLPARPSREG